jgi:internalin A
MDYKTLNTPDEIALSLIDDMVGKVGGLYLSSLGLKNLPPKIGELKLLGVLDLSINNLTTLPVEIGKLSNLNYLDVSDNKLDSLPIEITKLKDLSFLILSNNQITTLPKEINDLKQLKVLNLNGNPLPIPPEILGRINEPKTILHYYFTIAGRKVDLNETKALSEIKLLLVGQGSVGKTSIIQRILHDTFDQNQNKTEGISISQWMVDGSAPIKKKTRSSTINQRYSAVDDKTNQIKINIWDFGGQEIMHATHQFFLTKRSLYLLVLDSRLTQEENRVEYWLKIIQSYGGESPVLIIGNKIDQHPLDIDRTGLRNKYPNIIGVLETSAATGAGIPELRHAIFEKVETIPHIHDLLPATWFKVKTHIESLSNNKNYLSHDEYISLCTENSVIDELSQRTLIGFLHDLGIVLYFQDDPRLAALGILNPQWVTNGVYKILNSHDLFDNKGVLERAMLEDILNFPEYPISKHLFIIDMMRKFELCYDIEPDKIFLVPDLLPKDEPFTGEWIDALAFQYQYNVLPSSIISRFIVRMNASIHKTVWRSGVVLKRSGNTALVKADMEDRRIYIWVSGDTTTRRDFLSVIRAEFEAIHKTIAKIEAREKVPVPAHSEVVVDYNHLLNLERLGETTFIPEGLHEKVEVSKLLNGILTDTEIQTRVKVIQNKPVPAISEPIRNPVQLPEISEPIQNPVQLLAIPSRKKSSLLPILTSVFISFPRIIGRSILDLFGRDKAADSTAVLLGYFLIVITVLLIWGVLDLNAMVQVFINIWRFFFPVK